jgi:hypothetical protein
MWLGFRPPPIEPEPRPQGVERGPDSEDISWALLRSWLSPSQLADFEAKGWFYVKGEATGTKYRLRKGKNYNVFPLDDNGKQTRGVYCFRPSLDPGGYTFLSVNELPLGDQLLAQKIWLETDEAATLETANKVHQAYNTLGVDDD